MKQDVNSAVEITGDKDRAWFGQKIKAQNVDYILSFIFLGELVYGIKIDGSVEFGPGMTEEEAARKAAQILDQYVLNVFGLEEKDNV